ncbi:MAG: AMIN-like domain-containing (lipo)protein [Pseudonocardiaceae bacterium]
MTGRGVAATALCAAVVIGCGGCDQSRPWVPVVPVSPAQPTAPEHPTAPAQPTPPANPAMPDTPVLTGIRTGTHPTFDRIVLDFSGPRPQVSSRFVAEVIRDGSGNVERLPGAVFAEVRVSPAQAHGDAGQPSYGGSRGLTTGALRNVTALAITGDFEGVLSLGIGMRKQTWVHTSTVGSPTRVVIDVGR